MQKTLVFFFYTMIAIAFFAPLVAGAEALSYCDLYLLGTDPHYKNGVNINSIDAEEPRSPLVNARYPFLVTQPRSQQKILRSVGATSSDRATAIDRELMAARADALLHKPDSFEAQFRYLNALAAEMESTGVRVRIRVAPDPKEIFLEHTDLPFTEEEIQRRLDSQTNRDEILPFISLRFYIEPDLEAARLGKPLPWIVELANYLVSQPSPVLLAFDIAHDTAFTPFAEKNLDSTFTPAIFLPESFISAEMLAPPKTVFHELGHLLEAQLRRDGAPEAWAYIQSVFLDENPFKEVDARFGRHYRNHSIEEVKMYSLDAMRMFEAAQNIYKYAVAQQSQRMAKLAKYFLEDSTLAKNRASAMLNANIELYQGAVTHLKSDLGGQSWFEPTQYNELRFKVTLPSGNSLIYEARDQTDFDLMTANPSLLIAILEDFYKTKLPEVANAMAELTSQVQPLMEEIESLIGATQSEW